MSEFQVKVKSQFRNLYDKLKDVEPIIMDVTGKSIEGLGSEIETMVLTRLKSDVRKSVTDTLW